ncbi:FAD-dependent oxidoreductase [Myxococcota bacterium]|nr:FAD-dependent oxidoreductase [Myxococcota bacterium]
MYLYKKKLARGLGDESEAEILTAFIRSRGLWRELGFERLPAENCFAFPHAIRTPVGVQKNLIEATLVFSLSKKSPELDAILFHGGWSDSRDRARIGKWVTIHSKSDVSGLKAALGWLFTERKARVLRLSPENIEATLSKDAEASRIDIQGTPWDEFKARSFVAEGSDYLGDVPKLSKADEKSLLQKRSSSASSSRDFDIEVRNPSEIHRYFIHGGPFFRKRVFPEKSAPQDVDFLVVGGGISGLTAAHALLPDKTTVIEFADRIGGTAAAGETERSRFPLGAHYEHDLPTWFGQEVIQLWQDLDIVEREPSDDQYRFVDRQYLVHSDSGEQHLDSLQILHPHPWNFLSENPDIREQLVPFIGQMTLPGRLSSDELKKLNDYTFQEWLRENDIVLPYYALEMLNTGFRSDYGGDLTEVSAYAGLHYLTSRPHMLGTTSTFSPPEGLAYFAERLQERTPGLDLRLRHMVRSLKDHGDHIEVVVLDLDKKESLIFRAKGVVFAAPKKLLPYLYPADVPLFEKNVYTAWTTVMMQMRDLPERHLLRWSNGISDPKRVYVGMAWANHLDPDDPPMISHYLAFPPGRIHHLQAYLSRPQKLIDYCLDKMEQLYGRRVDELVEKVVIQKLGHAMPTPVPGSLFTRPNDHRSCPRIAYAGVDTGRLPLLVEAFDSGIEAARLVKEARG